MLGPVGRHLMYPALPLAAALVLATAAYARVLDGEFQYDDLDAIERNPAVLQHTALDAGRIARGWVDGGRVVTDASFAWNHALWGLAPRSFHVTNLAIHLAASILVAGLATTVLRLAGASRPRFVAVAIAGAFALHPLHSETVSYASQRSESLASALYVAAVLLALRAERRGLAWRAAPAWAAALMAFAAALGAKAIAVTMPAAWILVAAVVPSRERRSDLLTWRRRLVALTPFLVVDALFASRVLAGIEGSGDAGTSVPGLSPWTYFLTQLRVVVLYLRLLLWPAGQNVDWDFPVARGLGEPATWGCALLLLVLAASAALLPRAARRWNGNDAAAARVASLGLLWFFLVLSVTSSVVPLADVVAEHRTYLASFGLFAALAVAAERLVARMPAHRQPAIAVALVAILWAAYAGALHRRNAVWETRRALWQDAVAKSPAKARAWFQLAHAALREGSLEESVRLGRLALVLARGRVGLEAEILANLGGAEILLGRPAEAEATLRGALETGRAHPDVLVNLAVALLAQDRPLEAEPFAARAAATAPGNAHARSALGEVALRKGDPARALALFDEAATLEPWIEVHQLDRGRALAMLGRVDEACGAWARLEAASDGDLRAAAARARAEYRCEHRQ